ncbi:hypothetical protein GCM10010304_82270 [Streptomyces roseoviolaceus]
MPNDELSTPTPCRPSGGLHLTGTVPDLADPRDHVVARLSGLPCMTHAVVDRVDPTICCPQGAPAAVVVCAYEHATSACFRIDEAFPGAESLPTRWSQALEEMTATFSELRLEVRPAAR